MATTVLTGAQVSPSGQQGPMGVNVPVGSILDFAGTIEPAGWLLCYGQLVSRTTYADLFGVIGTTYHAGDGSTFGIPDLRGRVAAGKDDMGGIAANRLQTAWGVDGASLGANGGDQAHQLTVAQMPAHTHLVGHNFIASSGLQGGSTWNLNQTPSGSTGGSAQHPNVQPTIVTNKIIKY